MTVGEDNRWVQRTCIIPTPPELEYITISLI